VIDAENTTRNVSLNLMSLDKSEKNNFNSYIFYITDYKY